MKKGGFVFAIETGTPITPIAIVGSGDLRSRASLLFQRRSRLRLVVRPPIATAGLDLADRDGRAARVRTALAAIVDARLTELRPARHDRLSAARALVARAGARNRYPRAGPQSAAVATALAQA